jgi:cytochrome c-type biogenesis protein
MDPGSLGLALLAGGVSTLSPCVLPLLPLVLGTAVSEHRFGPAALAAGLALSFTAIGLFVATVGFGIGLDTAVFRWVAALLILAAGTVLLVPALQLRVATAAGPLGGWIENRGRGLPTAGLRGQFLLGLLLGAIWTPCVGPTLGAASLLAARGENLMSVALVMVAFGIGAAIPLLALGLLSRAAMMRLRDRLLRAGQGGRMVLGVLFVLLGLMILSGFDKRLESRLVDLSPDWLVNLTTRF